MLPPSVRVWRQSLFSGSFPSIFPSNPAPGVFDRATCLVADVIEVQYGQEPLPLQVDRPLILLGAHLHQRYRVCLQVVGGAGVSSSGFDAKMAGFEATHDTVLRNTQLVRFVARAFHVVRAVALRHVNGAGSAWADRAVGKRYVFPRIVITYSLDAFCRNLFRLVSLLAALDGKPHVGTRVHQPKNHALDLCDIMWRHAMARSGKHRGCAAGGRGGLMGVSRQNPSAAVAGSTTGRSESRWILQLFVIILGKTM